MKRFLIVGLFALLPLVACLAGLWYHRSSLSWDAVATGRVFAKPAEAEYPMRFPEAAFPQPDGGFAILDDGGRRLLRVDAQGTFQWAAGNDGTYGSFIACDAGADGTLYAIDRLPGQPRVERVVRIGPDGLPAGVISQKTFQGSGGYVPGSLRIAGEEAWYLFTGDDGYTSLARADLDSNREKTVIKTEWRIGRASLAVRDGEVYLAVGGGLLRFASGRFQSLPEYADELPHPGEVRVAPDGRLLVSDASKGVLAALGPDGGLSTVLDAESLGKASVRPTGIIFDSFSLRDSAFVMVDQASNMVMVVEGDGRVSKLLRTITWPERSVVLERRAWLLAAASAALALVGLALLLSLAAHRSAPLPSSLIRALPVFALALAGSVAAFSLLRSNARDGLIRSELDGLKEAALRGAVTLPLDLVAGVDGPEDKDGPAWQALKERLAALAGASSHDGKNPFAILYRESAGALRFIADARGDFTPGLPQRYAFPEYRRVFREANPDTGILVDGKGRWLAAMAPLKDSQGHAVAILELSLPEPPPPAIMPGLLDWLAAGFAYLGTAFLAYLRLRRARSQTVTTRAESEEPDTAPLAPAPMQAAPPLEPQRHEVNPHDAHPHDASHREAPRKEHALAVKALKEGRNREAVELLRSILKDDPADARALNNLAVAYKRSGEPGAAMDCLERCLALDPSNQEARRNLERLRAAPRP